MIYRVALPPPSSFLPPNYLSICLLPAACPANSATRLSYSLPPTQKFSLCSLPLPVRPPAHPHTLSLSLYTPLIKIHQGTVGLRISPSRTSHLKEEKKRKTTIHRQSNQSPIQTCTLREKEKTKRRESTIGKEGRKEGRKGVVYLLVYKSITTTNQSRKESIDNSTAPMVMNKRTECLFTPVQYE